MSGKHDVQLKDTRFELLYCRIGRLICFGVLFLLSFTMWLYPAHIAYRFYMLKPIHFPVPTICIVLPTLLSMVLIIVPALMWADQLQLLRCELVKIKDSYRIWKNS